MNLTAFSIKIALLGLLLSSFLIAAPYPDTGRETEWTQSDGTKISLRVFGNEFYGRTETTEGYTVTLNKEDLNYYYSELDDDQNELICSSDIVGSEPSKNRPKHLCLPKKRILEKVHQRRQRFTPDEDERWQKKVRAAARRRTAEKRMSETFEKSEETSRENMANVEEFVGLTILVQFPDDTRTAGFDPVNFPASQSKMERFCNQVGYSDDGNTGSVRDYFEQQSLGQVVYTQIVTNIITLPNPRNWYNFADYPTNLTLRDGGFAGRLVTEHAVNILKRQNFDFTRLSTNSRQRVLATNILFAGPDSGVWPDGLWPHRWHLSPDLNVGTGGNDLFIDDYQITNARTSAVPIGTFIHESGHLLLDFPDLYDTNGGSSGIGRHGLMGSGNHVNNGKTPTPINPYFKDVAGWATVTDLNSFSSLTGSLPTTGNIFYRIRKPGTMSEYFLIENRGSGDPWATHAPDQGIMIWHIDETVEGNQNEQMTPTMHYGVSLEQADGSFDLERERNRGDRNDCYDRFTQGFTDGTTPNARWWNGSNSGVDIKILSSTGPSMNVRFGGLEPGTLLVGSPNGGESVIPGGISEIKWGANISGSVKIELLKNGVFNQVIAESEANDGSYLWMVSEDLAVGNDYRIRISSVLDSSKNDSSDSNFSVAPEQFPAQGQIPENWVKPAAANIGWELGTDQFREGVLSLKSGGVGRLETAAIQTEQIFTPGTISFQAKVSSESGFDFFQFWINGRKELELSGEQDWQEYSFPISAGGHILEWRYAKDGSVEGGDDAAWIDQVILPDSASEDAIFIASPKDDTIISPGATFQIRWISAFPGNAKIELLRDGAVIEELTPSTPNSSRYNWRVPPDIEEAENYQIRITSLNSPEITADSLGTFSIKTELFPEMGEIPAAWTKPSDADAGWRVSNDQAFNSALSLTNRRITHLQKAVIEHTGIFVPGEISFKVRTSSELNFDTFTFNLNGEPLATRSGETDWETLSFDIPAGRHFFQWSYQKDTSASSGSDAVWIDDVTFPTQLDDGEILIQTPHAETTIAPGDLYEVKWVAAFLGNVQIKLYQDTEEVRQLSFDEPNDGIFFWRVPANLAEADNYWLKITSTTNEERTQSSPQFSVKTEVFPPNAEFPTDWNMPAEAHAGWEVSSTEAFDGNASLMSSTVSDSQFAAVQMEDTFAEGLVRFAVKLSSQAASDQFEFLIDGESQVTLSGVIDWQQMNVPISAGFHFLEWRYRKDNSGSGGEDRAWIDSVEIISLTPIMAWRYEHFNLTEDDGEAADLFDADGDGQNNFAEFLSGTNPNDASDFFHIKSARYQEGGFEVSFDGKSGKTYQLYRSAGLDKNWETVGLSALATVDAEMTLMEPTPPEGTYFYRVQVTNSEDSQ